MKASSYFTDGEIELAMGILGELLTNKDFIDEISISHDASDKYYQLIDKINIYFNDLNLINEAHQE
jgi:hypothetical protein